MTTRTSSAGSRDEALSSPLPAASPAGDDEPTPTAARPRRRGWLATISLLIIATAIPFAATWIAYFILKPANRLETISVGFVTGLAVGQLIGIQRRRLGAFLFGPAIGMLIGYLDLRSFVWFYVHAEWPLNVVSVLPVWGIGFGLWIALYYERWLHRWMVFTTIVGANLLSQLAWLFVPATVHQKLGESITYLEPTVFVAPVIAVVLLTPAKPLDSLAADRPT